MRYINNKSYLLSSVFLVSALTGNNAYAQQDRSSSPHIADAKSSIAIKDEDIVVTARRSKERLQDVPLAVTAYSANKIQNNRIVTLNDLNGLVPSLNYQPNYQRTGSGAIFFRGLTNGAGGLGTKASVFLDGNYIATNAVAIPFNFFQRVEALPGPQSAQFGRATFGGALNYVTKDPTQQWSVTAHADYASYGDLNLDALISGPLTKDGRLRALVFGSHSSYQAPDSWKSPADILHPDGIRQGSQKEDFIAAKLVFDVTDKLQVKLTGTYAKINDAPQTFGIATPAFINTSLPVYTGFNPNTPQAGAKRYFLLGSTGALENAAGNGSIFSGNYFNIPDPNLHDISRRLAGQVNYGFGNGFAATFNASLEDEKAFAAGLDLDFTPFLGSTEVNQSTRTHENAFELRISSPTGNRLRVAIGAYSLFQRTTIGGLLNGAYRCTSVNATTYVPCLPTSDAALFNPTFANGNLVGFTGTSVYSPFSVSLASGTSTRDLSAFGMLSFDITKKLIINFEGRYQTEKLASTNFTTFNGNAKFNAFLPRVDLQYKFTPAIMAYALYSIGNNPGGFNAGVASSVPFGAPTSALQYAEEKLFNYEIGLKSQFFNRRVTLNLAAYREDWDNQTSQQVAVAPLSGLSYVYIANQGKSRVQGVEAQLDIAPVSGWTIGSTASLNSAKYRNYCDNTEPTIVNYYTPSQASQRCVVVNGETLVNVPKLTLSLQSDYEWQAASDLRLAIGGTFFHRDGMFADTLNLAKSEGQNQFNFRISATTGPIKLMVFCSNCTNNKGTNRLTTLTAPYYGSSANFSRQVSVNPTRPVQVGVKSTFSF
jgi:iron complex outermembrane receptor protein